MFGTGIISRLSFGWIADRIGPPALFISSSLQAASLLAYFGANGLTSLYVVTACSASSRAVSCRATR